MIKVYQKQPIQAEQFDGSQKYIFGHKVISYSALVDALTHIPIYYSILINHDDPDEETDEIVFEIGDWIMMEEEYIEAIDNETFKKMYDPLPVIPDYVSKYIRTMKLEGKSLGDAIKYWLRGDEIDKYIEDNSETFSRAWLDGYQVEEN